MTETQRIVLLIALNEKRGEQFDYDRMRYVESDPKAAAQAAIDRVKATIDRRGAKRAANLRGATHRAPTAASAPRN